MISRRLVLSAAIVLALATNAAAATILKTAAIFSPANSGIACVATNVTTRSMAVTFRMLDIDGAAIVSDFTFTLDPSKTFAIGPPTGDTHFGRCEFSFIGAKTSLRAAIEVSDGPTGTPQGNLPAE